MAWAWTSLSNVVMLTASVSANAWKWRLTSGTPFDQWSAVTAISDDSMQPNRTCSLGNDDPSFNPASIGNQLRGYDFGRAPSVSTTARGARGCQATFTWVVEAEWEGGTRARLDVSGDGIIEDYLLQLAFKPRNSRISVRHIIGGALITSTDANQLLVQPRLASGLGTMTFTIDLDDHKAKLDKPSLACVQAPTSMAPVIDGGSGSWRNTAHQDYLWMAEEFNRQYLNSHGKTHPDYQPTSASSELQLHYLNGRLWCFYGAVRNATRSLEEATRIDPSHVFSHLLLAKIRIGQGLHEAALQSLDVAARIQPQHWQTHLMRLHCLRGLGQLQSSRAVESHQNVCWHLKEACKQAKHIQAYPYMCDNKGHGGTARVRLLDEPFVNTTMPASDKDASRSTPPMKTKRHQGTMYEPAGRGMYGRHLQSSVARRKLRDARYVVLRKLFPSAVISLLQAWYKELDRTLDETAVFQEKTQRHEYLPEVVSTYLNLALVPFASAMTGTVVAPTYPFPITYIPGGSIHPHLDVSDNELSITFQVHLRGDRHGAGWPLVFLDPRGQELSNLNASNAKVVTLSDNDGVLYYGPDIVHWRDPLDATLTQIVFAFREEDVAHCNNQ